METKKVLVIRCCSWRIFDNVWKEIRNKFGHDAIYTLLTPSVSEELQKYEFNKILLLPNKGELRFKPLKHLVFLFKVMKWECDVVIWIYADKTGVDYGNIRILSRFIRAKKKLSINVCGEWKEELKDDKKWYFDLLEEIEHTFPFFFHNFIYLFLKYYRKISKRLFLRNKKNRPKKISFITTTLVSGGVEVLLLNVIKYLLSEGYEIQLITGSAGRLVNDYKKLPITLNIYDETSDQDIFGYEQLKWTVKCLKNFKPDVLINYHYRTFFIGLIAGILTRVPLLLRSENGIPDEQLKNTIIFKRMMCFENLFDKVFAVSHAVKNSLYWLDNDKCEVILGTCVEQEKFVSIPDLTIEDVQRSITFLTVARLTPLKGINYLLEAISLLKNKYEHLKFLIVGEGEIKEELLRQCRNLSVERYVEFLGYRNDIPELMSKSHVFILPSLVEGLPLVIVEAMLAGRCIISTAVGGVPEIITHGKTGFLIDPGNSDELANSIMTLIENRQLLVNLGYEARRSAKDNFTSRNMNEKIKNMILNEWGLLLNRGK